MDNSELARQFERVAMLMELTDEDPFRIKAYRQAAEALKNLSQPAQTQLEQGTLETVPGIGRGMAAKVQELLQSGTFPKLRELEALVPDGVVELIQLRGLGPKKVKLLWHEQGIHSPAALERAALDGHLGHIKGFGTKTITSLLESIRIWRESQGQLLLHHALKLADQLIEQLGAVLPKSVKFRLGESLLEGLPVVDRIELLAVYTAALDFQLIEASLVASGWQPFSGPDAVPAWTLTNHSVPVRLLFVQENNLPIATSRFNEGELIQLPSIRGILHVHSTWSDGMDDLRSLAFACRERGFEYLGITDHSRTAAYAGGLSVERVQAQWAEIDRLNTELAPFVILKGIESDILIDGSLDYPDEILHGFDFVIASVHSGFSMTEAQATDRLIKAVQHPATQILGHPTGRLLLKRHGYPIDHKAVIDACAACETAIELNCNPYRMDLDWLWIDYAQKCGVPISINPDAHRIYELDYLREGVLVARRGGLLKTSTLNTWSAAQLKAWFSCERKNGM